MKHPTSPDGKEKFLQLYKLANVYYVVAIVSLGVARRYVLYDKTDMHDDVWTLSLDCRMYSMCSVRL